MVAFADVSTAVDTCLTRDGKAPDDAQCMQTPPYSFDVNFMRDFLTDVSNALQPCAAQFDVTAFGIDRCLPMTVKALKQAIYTQVTT